MSIAYSILIHLDAILTNIILSKDVVFLVVVFAVLLCYLTPSLYTDST